MRGPDLKERAERNGKVRRTITKIEQTIAKLERMKGEYLEKAVAAKARGDSSSYNLAKSVLNTTLTQIRRAKEMLLNIQITAELQKIGDTNADFLTGMSTVAKQISRINKKSDFVKLQKEIDLALSGMEEAQAGLDGFLQSTDAQFAAISQAPGALTDRQIEELVSGKVSERELLMDEQIDKLISAAPSASSELAGRVNVGDGKPQPAPAPAAAKPFPSPDGTFRFGQRPSRAVTTAVLGDDEASRVPLADVLGAPLDEPAFVLGRDINGDIKCVKFSDAPVLLVGGAVGSGKSAFLHQLLCSLIISYTADKVRLLLVDLKSEELNAYNGAPHMVCDAINLAAGVVPALDALKAEAEKRYDAFAAAGMRDIAAYKAAGNDMPYIFAVFDELSDAAGLPAFELAFSRLARQARDAGIYIIAATRDMASVAPSVAASVTARVAFRSDEESAKAFGVPKAAALGGIGELIYSREGASEKCTAPFVSGEQVARVVNAVSEVAI